MEGVLLAALPFVEVLLRLDRPSLWLKVPAPVLSLSSVSGSFLLLVEGGLLERRDLVRETDAIALP